MSYISLVSHNRIAQFAARFEMQPDGSVVYYHPDRATGGLPCVLAEAEQLIEDYAQSYTRSLQWMMYWAIASGLVLGILEASETLMLSRWMQYLIILIPLPLTIYTGYQAGLQPLRVLGHRLPCAPPRSLESAFWQRVTALPASFFVMMLFINAGLAYHTFKNGLINLDMGNLFIISSSLVMIVTWGYGRYIRR
jgi:hypothetical protein